MVGIEVEIGITLNVMIVVGVIKTIMEMKIARTKTNLKQTTKRKVKVI
jgi:hypothetical protein